LTHITLAFVLISLARKPNIIFILTKNFNLNSKFFILMEEMRSKDQVLDLQIKVEKLFLVLLSKET